MDGQTNFRAMRGRLRVAATAALLGLLAAVRFAAAGIDDGITGIITDQTITSLGHAFYTGFTQAWQEPAGEGEAVNLTIRERPSARWGSLVWVEYREETVFRAFIFPGRGDPESMGASAAQQVATKVERMRLEKLLFKDPDLAASEF